VAPGYGDQPPKDPIDEMRDTLWDIEKHASEIEATLHALANAVEASSHKQREMLSELKIIRQAILALIVAVGFAAAFMFWR
jgi:hypothetical protein